MVSVWKQLVQTEKTPAAHYLAAAMHHDPRSIPLCIQHHIQLTSLSFQVSRPSYSWDTTISIFYPENPRSKSWLRSKFEVTMCHIRSTRIPFVPCQRALPFLRYSIFKIWPWKSKVNVIPEGHIVGTTPYQLISLSFDVYEPSHSYLLLLKNLTLKIQGQGHGRGEHWKSHHGPNILSTHIPFVPSQSAIPFLRYSIFRLWPWKSKVMVMGEANVESHNMGITLYRLTSLLFHVNLPSHSWDTTFFLNLTLKIQGHGHGWGQSWKIKSGCNILSTHIPFAPCQSAITFLRYSIFKIWPWKSKAKVMGEVNVESHNICPTLYWLTSLSFHVNLPSHSWDTTF